MSRQPIVTKENTLMSAHFNVLFVILFVEHVQDQQKLNVNLVLLPTLITSYPQLLLVLLFVLQEPTQI